MIRSLLSRKFIQDTLALQAGKIGVIALSFLSSVIVWRLMGPQRYGDFALAESFLIIWQSLDLSGVGTSTGVRLAVAIGAGDNSAILDLMAFYVKVSVAINVGLLLLIALLGAPVASLIYGGETRIVALALGLALGAVADGLYGLVIIALRSRRSMRTLALMQSGNQLVLTICMIAAVVISPTPESLVIARLVYSYSTLLLGWLIYGRLRGASYPSARVIFSRALSVSPRPYWRFGVANAVDKNIGSLFTEIPVQLVGIFAGARAVGYLNLAMSGIGQASVLTSAVFDNMQAVVPQAVGRGDFAGLWRNFRRVVLIIAVGSAVFFSLIVVIAPPLIPLILGARWLPAIPVLIVLAFYGAITTVGGLFAPLYRTFDLLRAIIGVKLIALALVLPLGALALARNSPAWMNRFVGIGMLPAYAGSQSGALTGAWIIDALFAISVTLTGVIALSELRKRAR